MCGLVHLYLNLHLLVAISYGLGTVERERLYLDITRLSVDGDADICSMSRGKGRKEEMRYQAKETYRDVYEGHLYCK